MLITTQNEIVSLMPTTRWDRPEQLLGYLEEEERVALEPLLGSTLYEFLLKEYERLIESYVDITATTIKPTGKAKTDPDVPYADVTARMERIHSGAPCDSESNIEDEEMSEVTPEDMKTVQLIRICQQIEFYRMISHKAGLLTVSFNEGGGMNVVTADGYDPAEEKRIDRVVKDAYMSAGRAVDSLLLFLESDAKGNRQFTEKWKDADAFYLHKDLLFQTAHVLNEYLDIKGERIAYVQLVRDIRFAQNTYLKTRIGAKLLKAVVDFANEGTIPPVAPAGSQEVVDDDASAQRSAVYDELLSLLRTALAFYVEARRTTVTHIVPFSGSTSRSSSGSALVEEKMARNDSMTVAQQAMAMACHYVKDNLDALGDAAVGTPIYNEAYASKEQEERDRQDAEAARDRICRERTMQNSKKLFTAFPPTHCKPETV